MNPTSPLERLRALGVEVMVEGNKLAIRGPQRVLDQELIEELRQQKRMLLKLLNERYQPGVRYKLARKDNIERIHGAPPGLSEWADASGYPRAGIVSIKGQVILVADVAEALMTDLMHVLGVAPEDWPPRRRR